MFINFISNIWYKIKIQYNIIKIRHEQSQFNTLIMTPAAGGVAAKTFYWHVVSGEDV